MLRSFLLPILLFASIGAASAAELRVRIGEVRAQTGTLAAMLVDSEAAWSGKAAPVAAQRVAPDGTATLELVFTDLAPGQYALRLMHDENDNGKLDTNLVGMPTEGYGFSNNPQVMRAATFEEARFDVTEAGASISIELR